MITLEEIYDTALEDDSLLLEGMPYPVAMAYKNVESKAIDYNKDIEEREKIPQININRGYNMFNFGKATYKEISKEEALSLIKDRANLNDNLSKMVFIFDLGDKFPDDKRYKLVRYDDKGNQIISVNNKDIFYRNELDNPIYGTYFWPLKEIIKHSNKIYLTDDKEYKIDDNDEIANTLYDKNEGKGYYIDDNSNYIYPFMEIDSKGNFNWITKDPINYRRKLNQSGYIKDTGDHNKRRYKNFQDYLKYSNSYWPQIYRKNLEEYKYYKSHGYSNSDIKKVEEKVNISLKHAKADFDANNKLYLFSRKPKAYSPEFDIHMSQANFNKLKILKTTAKYMDSRIEDIKEKASRTTNNPYGAAMKDLKSLIKRKEVLEKELEEIEQDIKYLNNSYTEEDKKEYEEAVDSKINALLDEYKDYINRVNKIRNRK